MKPGVILLFLSLLICACNETGSYRYEPSVAKYPSTQGCSNMVLNVAYLFRGEIVELRMNKELIFRSDTAIADGYILSQTFCLPQDQNYTLDLRTMRAGKLYLDTTIAAISGQQPYHLDISRPQPLNWKTYYQDSLLPQQRPYLPADSCVRFVALIADGNYLKGRAVPGSIR